MIEDWDFEDEDLEGLERDIAKRSSKAKKISMKIAKHLKSQSDITVELRTYSDSHGVIADYKYENTILRVIISVDYMMQEIMIAINANINCKKNRRIILAQHLASVNGFCRFGKYHIDDEYGDVFYTYRYLYEREDDDKCVSTFYIDQFDKYLNASIGVVKHDHKEISSICNGIINDEQKRSYLICIKSFIEE